MATSVHQGQIAGFPPYSLTMTTTVSTTVHPQAQTRKPANATPPHRLRFWHFCIAFWCSGLRGSSQTSARPTG